MKLAKRFVFWLTGWLPEPLAFAVSEWFERKPEAVPQREIERLVQQARFDRFVTGAARAE